MRRLCFEDRQSLGSKQLWELYRTLLELPEFESARALLLRSAMGLRFSSSTAYPQENRAVGSFGFCR